MTFKCVRVSSHDVIVTVLNSWKSCRNHIDLISCKLSLKSTHLPAVIMAVNVNMRH